MLLQQIEWFEATMLVQWSIQIYRTFYIIFDCMRVLLFVIFTHHTCLNTNPTKSAKRLQLRCSFTIVIVFWNWHWRVMSLLLCDWDPHPKCPTNVHQIFLLFFRGLLLVDLFVWALCPSFAWEETLANRGKRLVLGEVLYFYEKPPIPILQNKLN